MKRDTKIGITLFAAIILAGLTYIAVSYNSINKNNEDILIDVLYLTDYRRHMIKSGNYGHSLKGDLNWTLGDVIKISETDIEINGTSIFEQARQAAWQIIKKHNAKDEKYAYVLTLSERNYYIPANKGRTTAIDYYLFYITTDSQSRKVFSLGEVHFHEGGDISLSFTNEYINMNTAFRPKDQIESTRRNSERYYYEEDESWRSSGIYGRNPNGEGDAW